MLHIPICIHYSKNSLRWHIADEGTKEIIEEKCGMIFFFLNDSCSYFRNPANLFLFESFACIDRFVIVIKLCFLFRPAACASCETQNCRHHFHHLWTLDHHNFCRGDCLLLTKAPKSLSVFHRPIVIAKDCLDFSDNFFCEKHSYTSRSTHFT